MRSGLVFWGGASMMMMIMTMMMMAGSTIGSQWCVVNKDRLKEDVAVETAMTYACVAGGDCIPIQEGGVCYEPNDLENHASYAFSSYWHNTNATGGTCDLEGFGVLTGDDPSHDGCVFPSL
eukprot:Gb_19419 [translate_table: standard]